MVARCSSLVNYRCDAPFNSSSLFQLSVALSLYLLATYFSFFLKSIIFTVTNDLTYDQRMHRICTTLSATYQVTLVGRKMVNSVAMQPAPYAQRRLAVVFTSGKLMYLAYNCRLLFTLLFARADCYCAIDLDTILPVLIASFVRRKRRVYDAHELFTEQKEIVTRPSIYKLWLAVERFAVPKFKLGYTVNSFIAGELYRRYAVRYQVVRNLPNLQPLTPQPRSGENFIIYQGAVNEGRSFETLIPAMQYINARLVICGTGNFMKQVQQLIVQHNVQHKVELRGAVAPAELQQLTPRATVAIMLFEDTGLNQYQSLANRFFDYIMAGVPQVCINFPQYKALNDEFKIASLIADNRAETIAGAVNNLLENAVYHATLQKNCLLARQILNWQTEEQKLKDFYTSVLGE